MLASFEPHCAQLRLFGSALASPDLSTRIHFVRVKSRSDAAAAWLAEASERLLQPLRSQGMIVSSGPEILADAVNLAAPSSLSRWLSPYYKSYVISLRCDLEAVAQCDWEVVPLHLDAPGRRRSTMPLWSEAITERSSLRRARIENVLISTPLGASAGWLDATGLTREFGARNVAVRSSGPEQTDFSDIDLLIADCAALRAAARPYRSPLVSAWRAGIPALLVDTAIERSERQSALDYISVTSGADVLAAISQLRSHPQLYESLQRRAQDRARTLSDGSITADWLRTLRDRLIPEANTVLESRRRHPLASMARQARRWFVQQSLRAASR